VIDLPPMPKTPRLDVAVVVADGPGLEFLPEFKADAAHVVLAANMVDRLDGRYKGLANSAVALPYSPAVARAYAKLTPAILPHNPKARPSPCPTRRRWPGPTPSSRPPYCRTTPRRGR